MPTFNIRIGGTAPDGTYAPNPGGLVQGGPIVPVTLQISDSLRQVLRKQRKAIPKPVSGVALIDTGASSTCFDEDAAAQARLPIVNIGKMSSATHTNVEVPVYDGQLVLEGFGNFNVTAAMGVKLSSLGLHVPELGNVVALIGRDALSACVLVYHGAEGFVSLSL